MSLLDLNTFITSQPVLSALGSNIPSSLASDANQLLNNSSFAKVFSAVVPQADQNIISQFLGSQGDGTAMSDIQSRRDPQLLYHWTVLMPFGFPPAYIEEATLPFYKIEAIPFHQANSSISTPGFKSIDQVSVTFYEDNVGTTTNYILQWQKLVEDGGFYGQPSDYKQLMTFTLHDSKLNPVMVATCSGAWPLGPDPVALESASSTNMRVQCAFAIDDIQWEISGQGGFLSKLGIDLGLGDGVTGTVANIATKALAKTGLNAITNLF